MTMARHRLEGSGARRDHEKSHNTRKRNFSLFSTHKYKSAQTTYKALRPSISSMVIPLKAQSVAKARATSASQSSLQHHDLGAIMQGEGTRTIAIPSATKGGRLSPATEVQPCHYLAPLDTGSVTKQCYFLLLLFLRQLQEDVERSSIEITTKCLPLGFRRKLEMSPVTIHFGSSNC